VTVPVKWSYYADRSISRVEERDGWLGRHGDPGCVPDRGWFQADEPTNAEERAADVRELGRAA
jgi:hypothetical protein